MEQLTIKNLFLEQENLRNTILQTEYYEWKTVKNIKKKSLQHIKTTFQKKNVETINFCKKLIKILYFITKTNTIINFELAFGGEWLSYLMLKKDFYDKDIIVFSEKPKISNYKKIQKFVIYLKNCGLITQINPISTCENKIYIETQITIDSCTKTIKFHYQPPFMNSNVNLLYIKYKTGIHTNYKYYDIGTEILDAFVNNTIIFTQDSPVFNFQHSNCETRIDFINKLNEAYNFINQQINVACYIPQLIYNCECCIHQHIVYGPLLKLKCNHVICLEDLTKLVSYHGALHSKCPMCREYIDFNLIPKHNISTLIQYHDEEIGNDTIINYFANLY